MLVGRTLLVAPTSSAVLCRHVLVLVRGEQVCRLKFQMCLLCLPLVSRVEWPAHVRQYNTVAVVAQHLNELSGSNAEASCVVC